MKRAAVTSIFLVAALAACDSDLIIVDDPDDGLAPDAPRAVAVPYYAGSVSVTWELGPAWDGEAFRIYSRRQQTI